MPRTWSTLDVPDRQRFGYWREMICQAFLALTPESDRRDGFAGSVTQWPLGALSIARIVSRRQRVDRTERDLAAGSPPGFYANLQLSGVSTMRQGGRLAVLRPGDVAVVDTTEPFTFEFGGDFRQLSFFVPDRLLRPRVTGRIATATRIPTTAGAGAALRHLLTALPAGSPRLAPHAAAILAETLSEPVVVTPRRAPHTHARAVADIEEHLGDDDLSPAATAQRLDISVRSLHSLFAGRELSYSATVRRLRLDRAARDLGDPARSRLRVTDIAADAGFTGVTAFHRAFRREFGRTPGQLREDPAYRRKMPYVVDFATVSTVGLESSPVAEALAGLRANETRYFKNKYGHVFTTEPAADAQATVDWVHGILSDERKLVIASPPLEATAFQVEDIRMAYVFYRSGLSINVMYTVADGGKRAVGFKLSDGMDVPAELGDFKFARQRSKLAGTIRGSYFVIKREH